MGDERHGVRRTGLGMMLVFWGLFIGLGSWWLQDVLVRRENPNAHLVDAVAGDTLALERNVSGHFVATGRINGEPVRMLLDTGATYVAVPAGLADRLGLTPEGSAWFSTANGRVRGQLTTLDEISLGGFTARDVRGSISPGLEEGGVLLGMSFLGRFDIEIRGERMVLRLPQRGEAP
ncbi:TIGR02281 family clan AA aspartic protease [Halomonas sp. M4R1S46]|uniref:retropepsin-like aspartic protease family protein n=1 Tax=Halomonas sp. M4R1S46 TaxID=2982692 RepID=UPI0021E4D3E9|nr:retropepsin-like aspartic protease [Halomonas sp. M4R1S46]UYG07396.1 retroviral-like aspartic protease family protein [Halomonas sp. M4R1S46]